MERYLLEEWQQVEKELLRERSLWGPATGSRLQKWMLDMTEGHFDSTCLLSVWRSRMMLFLDHRCSVKFSVTIKYCYL